MYAVVDLETTGLHPGGHDRVVEAAVVLVDSQGGAQHRWCTLVNPERDLGPQHIHGIRAADVLNAPTFTQIAGHLAQLLAGRVVVAHNLRFDARFLQAEYARLGVRVPLQPDLGLCTMQLANRFLPYVGRTLAECCAAAGIPLTSAHSALHDAQGAADLLAFYLRRAGNPPPWKRVVTAATRAQWPDLPAPPVVPAPRRAPGTADKHFLQRLVARLPRVGDEDADAYLDLLDRVLLDRRISATEAQALVEFARSTGLGREQVSELHLRYLEALAIVAGDDGTVTEQERSDLVRVASLLALNEHHVDHALKRAAELEHTVSAEPGRLRGSGLGRFQLRPGDQVVFTGQLDQLRETWEARAADAGLVPWPNVTRKTVLVIAADPDSQSGKARRAREYGIPIVGASTFVRLCRQSFASTARTRTLT